MGQDHGISNQLNKLKWPIFRQADKIGTGKNKKSLFFLLGLKYTLRACFESKGFCQIPVLS